MKCRKENSLYSLSKRVSQFTKSGDLDHALHLIHRFVERIFTEPLCTSQVVGSRTLDDLCQRIGKANLAAIDRDRILIDPESDKPIFVYIVSKLERSGGHSRVIEDFIKGRPFARHVVLSSELNGRSDVDYVFDRLAGQGHVTFESARKGDNFHQRLMWLQKRLLAIRPNRAYLFNHHQDCIAVAAVQPEMGFDLSFYHHGDHHLCLGVYLSFAEHIDPHPMGYYDCRHELGIKNVYIPLTVDDKGMRPSNWPFIPEGKITTCTAARSNKIEIPYFVSYLDVVPELLKVTGGRHVHIGRLTPWAIFRIKRGLKRLGIPHDRFVYIPWVPSVWTALHEYRVDLYVASFPYGGGLTLIETMGAGIPVALHQHVFSRVLSGIDLAYPEAFSWQVPDELLHFCASVTPEYLRHQSILARRQYLNYHRQQILMDILASAESITISPREFSDKFLPRRDEFASLMEGSVNIGHLAKRAVYRFFRNFRSKYL